MCCTYSLYLFLSRHRPLPLFFAFIWKGNQFAAGIFCTNTKQFLPIHAHILTLTTTSPSTYTIPTIPFIPLHVSSLPSIIPSSVLCHSRLHFFALFLSGSSTLFSSTSSSSSFPTHLVLLLVLVSIFLLVMFTILMAVLTIFILLFFLPLRLVLFFLQLFHLLGSEEEALRIREEAIRDALSR